MAMEMMANDSINPTSDRDRLLLVGRQPRERRSTHLRHGMDQGGTEFTVCQTKISLGLPIIFRLPAT